MVVVHSEDPRLELVDGSLLPRPDASEDDRYVHGVDLDLVGDPVLGVGPYAKSGVKCALHILEFNYNY